MDILTCLFSSFAVILKFSTIVITIYYYTLYLDNFIKILFFGTYLLTVPKNRGIIATVN